MVRWLCLLVTGGVVSGFAFLLVTGEYANDGPVVLRLSGNHGLHIGDLFVLVGWLAAMAALGWLGCSLLSPRSVRPSRAPATGTPSDSAG